MASTPLATAAAAPLRLDYDAVRAAPEDIVYAVIRLEDIARLPGDPLLGIDFRETAEDGFPRAFHAVAPDGAAFLHLDSDRHERVIDDVIDAARDAGIPLENEMGFLRAIALPDGRLAAPEMSRFQRDGLTMISLAEGRARIEALREKLNDAAAPGF